MAFIQVQLTTLFLIFLFSNILRDNLTGAVHIPHKCRCPEMNNNVKWKRVTDFKVFKPGSMCNKVEIIIKEGKKSICLAPHSKQGKKLQKCWKRIKYNHRKKLSCVKSKKRQKPKRQYRPK